MSGYDEEEEEFWFFEDMEEERARRKKQKQGCYIATAVYGSYDCPQVRVLRRFRDEILARSIPGRLFICLYYSVSPHMVHLFGKYFPILLRGPLNRIVSVLKRKGFPDTPYRDARN